MWKKMRAVQLKWYAIITVTRVKVFAVYIKPRANFNHFVLMESTRSVFKQLVQSSYKRFRLVGLFIISIHIHKQ